MSAKPPIAHWVDLKELRTDIHMTDVRLEAGKNRVITSGSEALFGLLYQHEGTSEGVCCVLER
jgi:hypothetical protein